MSNSLLFPAKGLREAGLYLAGPNPAGVGGEVRQRRARQDASAMAGEHVVDGIDAGCELLIRVAKPHRRHTIGKPAGLSVFAPVAGRRDYSVGLTC